MSALNSRFFPKYTAIVSGIGTAVIGVIMNLFLIPAIESNTGGIRCFDMNPGYDYETAKAFLELTGERGKELYLGYQLPLDFVYPVFYTVLFISLLVLLIGKKSALIALPCTLAVFDYAENILTEIMLRSESLSLTTVKIASAVTLIKTVLMYLVFLILFILIIKWVVLLIRKRHNAIKAEN
jgi:hypothetical protein